MKKLKQQIVEIGKKLAGKGYSPGYSGNISIKHNDKIFVTPSGFSLEEMEPDDIVVINNKFEVIEGTNKPSSESKMHLNIYNLRPDIKSIIHCHAPKSSAFAVAGIPLSAPILAENIFSLGEIPVAKYYLPSTKELADEVSSYFKDHDVVLMSNHGVVLGSHDIKSAFYKMDTVEYFAEVYLNAKLLSNMNELSKEQVEEIIELRKKFCK